MSVLHPIVFEQRTSRHFSFVPIATVIAVHDFDAARPRPIDQGTELAEQIFDTHVPGGGAVHSIISGHWHQALH
jgi:hypothetical protein